MEDYDMRKLRENLRDVIYNEGSFPDYHREVVKRHREEWPLLWNAIDDLLDDYVVRY